MTFQDILPSLIAQLNSATSSNVSTSESSSNQVIFESDIDGTHYYLVRCQPKSNPWLQLSQREQEIAQLVAEGLPNKCIAKKLGISQWTVSTYLRRIFAKLDVTTRAAMTAKLLGDDLLAS
ncbi:response regulator transcription factor [Capilliphycus salinus ALCB114379]|uniref:response regulator transcription factor n=1 Tax=Capilliphycus salinus TaxID=2768948 RepID=UPI0039A6BB32